MPPAYQGDPTKPNYYVGPDAVNFDLGKMFGVVPNYVQPGSPGGSIDTGQSEEDKQKVEQLIAQLQQQAATGNGSWQKALQTSTENAQNSASALGQSEEMQAKSGAAGALRNIGNAQSGAAQRAVGEGNILRAQTQQGAQDQLSTLLGEKGSQEANLANAQSGVAQQNREMNLALQEQATQNQNQLQSGFTQAGSFAAMASKGGQVPGAAKVFGDSERNDTVPAMLSPGEIVVPRTKAHDPRAAAEFAAAIARHHGKHLAGGGTPDQPDTGTQFGIGALSVLLPPVGQAARAAWMRDHGVGHADPSVGNGGLLDTSAYDATRDAGNTNNALLAQRAAGQGPSVVPQELTNAQDASMAAGLSAHHGAAGNVLQRATEEASGRGAGAARTAMGEQQGASKVFAQALMAQRQNDIALAQMKQQAAFRNTEMNSGLTLANQAAVRGILSGVGQAATAFSGLHSAPSTPGGGDTPDAPGTQNTRDYEANLQPDPSEMGGDFSAINSSDNVPADSGGVGAAFGGAMPDRDFAQALAGGGEARQTPLMVAPPPPREPPRQLHAEPVRHMGHVEDPGLDDFAVRRAGGGAIPGYDDGGRVVHTGRVKADATLNQLRADYDAGQARRAINKGPDLNYRASQFLDSLRGTMSAPPHDEIVRRAGGGSIPGYDEGGGIPELPPEAQGNFTPGAAVDAGTPAIPAASFQVPSTFGLDRRGPTGQVIPWEKTIEGAAASAKPKAAVRKEPASPAKPNGARPSLAAGFARAGTNPEPTLQDDATNAAVREQERLGQLQGDEETRAALHESELRKLAESSHAQAQELLTQHRRAVDDLAKDDAMGVDPGRYWASRSTGQKISGIIGLALGALGTGPDGINRSVGMLQTAIDRDIDAQKSEHSLRLQAGKQRLEGMQSLYGQAREMTGDDFTAKKLAFAAGLDVASAKAKRIAAEAQSPMIRQQAVLFAKQLDEKSAATRAETTLKLAEANFHNAQAAHVGAAKPGKQAELAQGAHAAAQELEQEFVRDPTSPRIGQLRASLMLHLNKLQGGRFNEEIHRMNESLIPGNEGASAWQRAQGKFDPEAVKRKFEIIHKHISATANAPPNPGDESDVGFQ